MSGEFVGRVLGPDTEPLSCEQCFEELDRYVEWTLGEREGTFETCAICNQPHECVGGSGCVAMRAHLESCSACDEEYASLRDLVLAERDA